MAKFPRRGVVLICCSATIPLLVVAGFLAILPRSPSSDSIAAGQMLFEHEFSVGDTLCGNGDGLGPVFNERSCVACHFLGGTGGAGPNDKNVLTFTALPVPGRADMFSGGIHSNAIADQLLESVEHLRHLVPTIRTRVDQMPGCGPSFQEFDPLHVEEINTPPLFGLGLLERIPQAAIVLHGTKRSLTKVSRELGGDFDGTGIGRTRNTGAGRRHIGKFGWKGQFASLEEFVANACAMELGLTNPRAVQPEAKRYQPDSNAEMDMTWRQLRQLVDYVRALPRPLQVLPTDEKLVREIVWGEQLFERIGCTDCHVRDLGGVEAVYSDFHLYNVEKDTDRGSGYGQQDLTPEFSMPHSHPGLDEWKTPPLWGVADSAPYFHDGQSPTLLAAILRHGHDARSVRKEFTQLEPNEKRAVIAFLESLKAPLIENSPAAL